MANLSSTTTHHEQVIKSSTAIMVLMHDLKAFRDFLQRHNWVPQPPVDGLSDDDSAKFTNGNNLIAQGYQSAQKHCDAVSVVANNLQNVVNGAYDYVESFPDLYNAFYDAMQAYIKNPKDRDNKDLIAGPDGFGQAIIASLAAFQTTISTDKTSLENLHNNLNADIAKMNEGIQAFEGLNGGVALDINNLSEATLRKKLMDRESDLRDKIHKLELECGFETAGAVGVGFVLGSVALAMSWNPVGWVAGAGLIVSEVFMGLDLKKRFDELHQDMAELAVSEEEENLLKPLFSTKRMLKQLSAVADQTDTLSSALNNSVDDLNKLIGDVQKDKTHFDKKENFWLPIDKKNILKKYNDLYRDLGKLRDATLKVIKNPTIKSPLPTTPVAQ